MFTRRQEFQDLCLLLPPIPTEKVNFTCPKMIALLSLASFSILAFGSKTDHSNLVMTDGRWSSKAQAPTPVPEIELLRYSGRWYQVYSDLASNTFVSVLGLVAFLNVFVWWEMPLFSGFCFQRYTLFLTAFSP